MPFTAIEVNGRFLVHQISLGGHKCFSGILMRIDSLCSPARPEANAPIFRCCDLRSQIRGETPRKSEELPESDRD